MTMIDTHGAKIIMDMLNSNNSLCYINIGNIINNVDNNSILQMDITPIEHILKERIEKKFNSIFS